MWRLANSLDGRLMLIWAVMVTVFGSADASPSVTTAALAQSVTTASPAPSGARFIVTQGLLDRLRDAFLPVALEFIRTCRKHSNLLNGGEPLWRAVHSHKRHP